MGRVGNGLLLGTYRVGVGGTFGTVKNTPFLGELVANAVLGSFGTGGIFHSIVAVLLD